MFIFQKGLNYSEYIKTATDEHLEFINQYYNESKLNKETIDEVSKINDEKNIIIVAETFCRDAAKTIPFLLKLSDINHLINIRFYKRDGNEDILEEVTGEKKIPTLLLVEDNKLLRKYIEFPLKVKEILKDTVPEEVQKVVNDMRNGKYDTLIQEDLIKFLTGTNYEYVRFDRKK